MASEPSNPPPQGADPVSPDQLVVNLQVVSPSVGVNRPLVFPGLAATTTIKQLKDKIRLSLPLRPADEHQRLIHRGRALLRESDSLLDVFGADTLRSPEQQTIHLVIRDLSDTPSSTPSSQPGTQSPAPGYQQPNNVPRPHPPHPPHPHFGPQQHPQVTRWTPFPATTTAPPQARMPSPARPHSPAHTSEQAAAFQHQHQNMTHWLTHIQREAMARAIVNQNQRGRAQMGMRGIGDNAPTGTGHGSETNSGRASPAPTHTIYRESIGPNGHSYHVETIVRTGPTPAVPSPQSGLSPVDVHNILRSADSTQSPSSLANALQPNALRRSASNTSLHNRSLNQAGVTSSVFVNSGSRISSGRATPDQLPRPLISGVGSTTPLSVPASSQSRQSTDVYILSSPEGPRALVFNNATAETYYTPRMLSQPSYPQIRNATSFPSLIHTIQPYTGGDAHPLTPQVDQRLPATDQSGTAAQPPQQQPHHQQQQQQQDQQPRVLPLHPNNPAAVGLHGLLMHVVPHLWLIVRLILFVWFFTSPDSSWSRWLTVFALAVFIFAFSTGILTGFADNAWRPLGRHLENVFPAVNPDHPRREGDAAGNGRADGGRNVNPAQMAARLVAERRERESWLTSQLRRLERAGLLFLASIAPGVAERHIANFEAEARAEENRRRESEAATAAATAAAATAAATTTTGDAQNEGETSGDVSRGETSGQQPEGREQGERRQEQDIQEREQLRQEVTAL